MTPRPTTQLGDLCSLYLDMPPGQSGLNRGDWVITKAGSRYLVETARAVRPHQPRPTVRWQLTVHRLTEHCTIPVDVRVVELRWYRR